MEQNKRDDTLNEYAEDKVKRHRIFVNNDGTIVDPDVASREVKMDENASYIQLEPGGWSTSMD